MSNARTIHKYPIATPLAGIAAPRGWRVLTVQMQDDVPTIWAEVNPDAVWDTHLIEVVGTGHPLPDEPRTYLGTVQRGPLVWHVYEVVRG